MGRDERHPRIKSKKESLSGFSGGLSRKICFPSAVRIADGLNNSYRTAFAESDLHFARVFCFAGLRSELFDLNRDAHASITIEITTKLSIRAHAGFKLEQAHIATV